MRRLQEENLLANLQLNPFNVNSLKNWLFSDPADDMSDKVSRNPTPYSKENTFNHSGGFSGSIGFNNPNNYGQNSSAVSGLSRWIIPYQSLLLGT